MQITVCVAVTPSTETKVKVAPDGKSLDVAEVKFELNPYDEFALEEALRLREARGEGQVEVLTVGDGSQKEEIRKCLARGADSAAILKADTSAADSAAIAGALAARIGAGASQVVFFGKQAVDGDNSQVPAHVAVALDWPLVGKVSKLAFDGDSFTAQREIEGGVEIIEGRLPAVFSAEKGLNEPRYPSLKGIMAAKKKPLEEVEVQLEAARVTCLSLGLPPARPEGRIVGEGAAVAAEVVRLLKEEAKVI
ncbi:MAG: electron transfer flavoprotein subunit beta/FixA family protein [Planctomycetes bacterium]|nr:electron transfer flavoprotein subunit beta/FixA family protein [Planctomycetota bacterium]